MTGATLFSPARWGAACAVTWALLAPPAFPTFTDVTARAGIHFRHNNGAFGKKYLPETMGSGCAFVDVDNDGWPDIILVNSRNWPGRAGPPSYPALYHNNHDGTFTDVTRQSGLAVEMYGLGVAAADYDNDGNEDIFITALDGNHLFHNEGGGKFRDVTAAAGVGAQTFSTGALWFDYDRDGKLDLFVTNYVDWSLEKDLFCTLDGTKKSYCTPESYKGRSPTLYHNLGNGKFEDVTRKAGLYDPTSKGLGVAMLDYDNDGWPDLMVTNDTQPNRLYRNQHNGTFIDLGVTAGVAFDEAGVARAGMGVDAADFDGDCRQDLFVANVDQEMFSLYHNDGHESFSDVAAGNGVAQATRLLSGWGLKFFDYDNDGLVDLFLANGHPDDMIDQYSQQVHYKEPLLLFHHDGRKLVNVSAEAGPAFKESFPARGLAIGDYNNDGRIDVIVGNNGGAPLLLKNNAGEGNHWLGVRLQGMSCNRDAIGATLTWSAGGIKRSRFKSSGGSYLSAHDPRDVLGIGTATKIDWLEIKWPQPSGRVERLTDLPVDRYVTIVEGKGRPS